VPIKITPLGGNASQVEDVSDFFFGYTGGTSGEENVVEISESAGRLMGLNDGELVQAAIEYSFEKLKQIELEPLTADDFEIIEKNCGFIEEQLLNQVAVFYDKQRFAVFINGAGPEGQSNVCVRLISKLRGQSKVARCFFLTTESELHIMPKLRPKPIPG
jgi:hypothetical protein